MKLAALGVVAMLALAGCATNHTTTTIVETVKIPTTLLDCDQKKVDLPNPENLTNIALIKYVSSVDSLLKECQNDVASIRAWEKKINDELAKRNAKG